MLFNQSRDYWKEKMGEYTAQEIFQQPETWLKTVEIVKSKHGEIEEFIADVVNQEDYRVIFSGAGTSEFVGNSLVPLFLKQGLDHFESIATTTLVATPHLYIREAQPTLMVSFGRSGNSPESIGAIDVVNAINPNVKHLVITCNREGALAKRLGSQYYSIVLPEETNDVSFAMTSSFTNMFLTAYLCFNPDGFALNQAKVNEAHALGLEILTQTFEALKAVCTSFNFNRLVYLGDGSLSGFAEESALKMLELTAGEVVTMFNSPLGFRHGPKSIINKDTLTVVYLSRDPYTRQYQFDIIKEISGQRMGNRLIAVDCIHDAEVAKLVDVYIPVQFSSASDDLMGMVYVIVAQLLALYRSLTLGKSPDNPWPSGMVNRVVQGVVIYPYERGVSS